MKSFITRVSALLAFILIFSSCSLFNDIKILNVSDFAPTAQDKQLLLKVNVQVQNENIFAVHVKETNLTVSIEDKVVGDLLLAEKVKITSKSSDSYPVKLKVKFADGAMFTLLRNALKKDVVVTLKGTVTGSALGIPKTIAVNETKTIDGNLLKSLSN